MGNTCGCVDPAEKDQEVKVDGNNMTKKQEKMNNYRDSTISKNAFKPTPVSFENIP